MRHLQNENTRSEVCLRWYQWRLEGIKSRTQGINPDWEEGHFFCFGRKEEEKDVYRFWKFYCFCSRKLRTFSSDCFYFIWETGHMRWGTNDTIGYLRRELTRKRWDCQASFKGNVRVAPNIRVAPICHHKRRSFVLFFLLQCSTIWFQP